MRTVAQIAKMIDDNKNRLEFHFAEMTKAERKRMVRNTETLVFLKRYLETNPKQEFVEKEKYRIKRLIASKQAKFHYWKTNVLEDDTISLIKKTRLFCKETGITQLRKQLKNLNFLLNDNQEQPATR